MQDKKSRVKVCGNKDDFNACWRAARIIVSKDIASTQDDAFLMEIMSDLARTIDNRKNNKAFELHMSFKKWRAIWHCLNICSSNKSLASQAQAASMLKIQSYIAIELDKHGVLDTPPLELLNGGKNGLD